MENFEFREFRRSESPQYWIGTYEFFIYENYVNIRESKNNSRSKKVVGSHFSKLMPDLFQNSFVSFLVNNMTWLEILGNLQNPGISINTQILIYKIPE